MQSDTGRLFSHLLRKTVFYLCSVKIRSEVADPMSMIWDITNSLEVAHIHGSMWKPEASGARIESKQKQALVFRRKTNKIYLFCICLSVLELF